MLGYRRSCAAMRANKVDLPEPVRPNTTECARSLTCRFKRKVVDPWVTQCIRAGAKGGYIGQGALTRPVQIVLVGTRSARFMVLISGRRTFSTPCPGKLPKYAS